MIKRFTTFSFVLVLVFSTSVLAQAQYKNVPITVESVGQRIIPSASIDARASMDTLTPASWFLACDTGGFVYTAAPNWGFIGGTNEYLDQEKAQRFAFSDASPFNVTEAWVYFDRAIVLGDADVSIKIYSTASDGGPDVLLGTSDPLKPSNFVIDDQVALPTSFPFSTPALVEVPEFFVSVDFSNSYNDMTDTIGIIMGAQDCGVPADSWELFSTGTWVPINDDQVSWNTDADFWMQPIIEFEEPSNTSDVFAAKKGLQIFPARPNPAYEQVDLPYELDNGTRVTIEVYAADGRLIERLDKGQLGPGSHVENYTVSNLPAGNYVYGIITAEARIMSRFVVNR